MATVERHLDVPRYRATAYGEIDYWKRLATTPLR